MSVQLLNQLFSQHFNLSQNDRSGVHRIGTDNNISTIIRSSLSSSEEKQELKSYTATYMSFSGGDDDCGMETQDVQANTYEEALSIAKQYPGRLYKLEEKL